MEHSNFRKKVVILQVNTRLRIKRAKSQLHKEVNLESNKNSTLFMTMKAQIYIL